MWAVWGDLEIAGGILSRIHEGDAREHNLVLHHVVLIMTDEGGVRGVIACDWAACGKQ